MPDITSTFSLESAALLATQLFEHSAECNKLLDGALRLVAINRSGLAALEIDDFETVRGTPWKDLWPPEAHALVDAAAACARQGEAGHFSAPSATRKGRLKWWEVTVTALPGPGAQAGYLVVSARDVTAAHQARAAREERERLLKELQVANERMTEVFMQAPAFMCVLRGPQHVFEMVNERYVQLVGQRPLVGLPVVEALPEVAAQGFIALLDRVYRTGEPFVASDLPVRLQRAPYMALEERYIDLVYIALRDADGEITGVLAHGIDQTHRTLAERSLHHSRERFEKIVSQAATGVVEMDTNGHVTLVNGRFCDMLGYTEQELLGISILDITAPDSLDPITLALGGLLATSEGFTIEKHYRRKDGTLMPATSSVNALRGANGDTQGLVAIVLDSTESKAAEATLRRLAADLAETDRRKTEFLATLAHELRNPLAPIRSGLGVMRLNRDLPPGMTRVREMMERQVTHMVHLIDDLLDVARISGGKLNLRIERMALNAAVSSAVETSLPLIEAAHHELDLDLPEEALMVDADATRIAQVVSNLLNNAAKYTPAGGRIGLGLRREGHEAVIHVSDTGIGIPRESLLTVFDMFSQVGSGAERTQGGLGIGLSLVRQLVQMHGGTVGAESGGSGAGSRFTVRLPLAREVAAPNAAADAAPEASSSPSSMRVLVVDDNVDAALTLSMILDIEGYVTRVAHGGREAVEMAAGFRPAVVFLDIGMPGMDGYETAGALRALPGMETLCLVALTGWGAEDDRARSKQAGFDHHLTKPVEMTTVQQLLGDLANGAPGRSGAG